MPQTMNITEPEQRETAIALYTAAGRFGDAVLPQLEDFGEKLRAVTAKARAAVPVNGQILRAALAGEQEDFGALAVQASPLLAGLVDFANNDIDGFVLALKTLATHPVVTDVLPQLIIVEEVVER